jgi:hypothetical protein
MKYISAKELANLGQCEQMVVLMKQHKPRYTQKIQKAIARGDNAHLTHHRNVQKYQTRPCIIATAVYGEHHPIVIRLRRWRDYQLLTHATGRVFVRAYYCFSPYGIYLINHLPGLRLVTRSLLRVIVWILR